MLIIIIATYPVVDKLIKKEVKAHLIIKKASATMTLPQRQGNL